GFMRIPNFEPADPNGALRQFQEETTYFQNNTSGLVIDVMGNGGGQLCFINDVMQYFFPTNFTTTGLALLASPFWVWDLDQFRELNRSLGVQSQVSIYDAILAPPRQESSGG